MNITPCSRLQAPEILAIFNDAIIHTTALYEYEPRTLEFMATWFDTKERNQLPVLGAFTDEGALMGFATYGTFRALPAYHFTVEHSVYVHANHRGRGIARALLRDLIATAQTQNYHALIGVIDSANTASIALHKNFGFVSAGTLRQVGFKFDRWLDVDLYQLVLPTPAKP
jgi:phosphinothricin acetyltransferase